MAASTDAHSDLTETSWLLLPGLHFKAASLFSSSSCQPILFDWLAGSSSLCPPTLTALELGRAGTWAVWLTTRVRSPPFPGNRPLCSLQWILKGPCLNFSLVLLKVAIRGMVLVPSKIPEGKKTPRNMALVPGTLGKKLWAHHIRSFEKHCLRSSSWPWEEIS